METNNKTIKGYKGFNSDMTCRGFQYEVGETYEMEEGITICERGFHFCENPLDVLAHYSPSDSRYCEVKGSGEVDRDNEDSKIACSKLKVGVEIGLTGLINAGVKFILDKVDWTNKKKYNTGDYSAATNTGHRSAATNTGYRSVATNTGDCSAATNTGCRSAATNTGYRSVATNTGHYSVATNTGHYSAASAKGKDSIAIALGFKSKAKGAAGCWIVLTERDEEWNILDVKAFKVDGENIKADTYYELVNGKAEEVK